MKIDYANGDVVVCISADDECASYGVTVGSIHRVDRVIEVAGQIGVILATAGHGDYLGYQADRFCRLPEADAEFTQQMRAIKPARHRVPA